MGLVNPEDTPIQNSMFITKSVFGNRQLFGIRSLHRRAAERGYFRTKDGYQSSLCRERG
jgi:hypothetical protein